MSAAFPPLETDAQLVASIKVVQRLFKSCDKNMSGSNAKTLDDTITAAIAEYITKSGGAAGSLGAPAAINIASLNSANQCRYFRAIISAIFDLETPITEWKIGILSNIFNGIPKTDPNPSELALTLFLIDKVVLYNNLASNKTAALNQFIAHNLFEHLKQNDFLKKYYINSANGNNDLLEPVTGVNISTM